VHALITYSSVAGDAYAATMLSGLQTNPCWAHTLLQLAAVNALNGKPPQYEPAIPSTGPHVSALPDVPLQLLPHAPQFAGSLVRSTQLAPHAVVPPVHSQTWLPESHSPRQQSDVALHALPMALQVAPELASSSSGASGSPSMDASGSLAASLVAEGAPSVACPPSWAPHIPPRSIVADSHALSQACIVDVDVAQAPPGP